VKSGSKLFSGTHTPPGTTLLPVPLTGHFCPAEPFLAPGATRV